MGNLARDFRHAVRRWTARPLFAATAVLTLTIGIGATTAIFAVVDAVVLKPLPWLHADRVGQTLVGPSMLGPYSFRPFSSFQRPAS